MRTSLVAVVIGCACIALSCGAPPSTGDGGTGGGAGGGTGGGMGGGVGGGAGGGGGGLDAGEPDAGDVDAGTPDAGDVDAGDVDAGTPDAGDVDAGTPDAGDVDAGGADAGDVDAGTPDAGGADAGADAGSDAGLPPPGPFDGGFVLANGYSLSGASYLSVNDQNIDGFPDILVVSATNVRWMLNRGDGGFTITNGFGGGPNVPAVADFNRDGLLDVAAAAYTSGSVYVIFGLPDAGFSSPTILTGSAGAGGTTSGDYNGDSLLDLAVAQYGMSTFGVGVHFATDAGAWGPRIPFLGGTNYHPVTADLNRDGYPDIAATTVGGGTKFTVWLGRPDGGFLANTNWDAGANANEATAADFDNDGLLDLLGSNYTGANVCVLHGNGDGTFGPPAFSPSGTGSAFHAAGDFNGDQRLDVVTVNFTARTMSLLWGRGDGTFVNGPDFALGVNPGDAVAADFNGDGKLDVATTQVNQVLVWFGR